MYDQKKTRPEGRVPRGKQKSHWNGVVLVRRKNQRVSPISEADERRIPAKIVADMMDMERLWMAGMGPSETERLRRRRRDKKRWRKRERRR